MRPSPPRPDTPPDVRRKKRKGRRRVVHLTIDRPARVLPQPEHREKRPAVAAREPQLVAADGMQVIAAPRHVLAVRGRRPRDQTVSVERRPRGPVRDRGPHVGVGEGAPGVGVAVPGRPAGLWVAWPAVYVCVVPAGVLSFPALPGSLLSRLCRNQVLLEVFVFAPGDFQQVPLEVFAPGEGQQVVDIRCCLG